jgi:hypothetical protein
MDVFYADQSSRAKKIAHNENGNNIRITAWNKLELKNSTPKYQQRDRAREIRRDTRGVI